MPKRDQSPDWASNPSCVPDIPEPSNMPQRGRSPRWASSPPRVPDSAGRRSTHWRGRRRSSWNISSAPDPTTQRDSFSDSIKNASLSDTNEAAPTNPPTNLSLALLLFAVTLVSASDASLNRLFIFGFGVFIGANYDMRDLLNRLGLPPTLA
ncbi:uncharacterized protein N7483_010503 [Penicillium malachiteum]|uniref:uncharacterized protein n=1 Tax=Penicillium malachiteum TaxID=1324776 RepID=UPI002548DECF|nr:uncharacterized protein N7483_010503 [Penicillium malachiteum]KAJ5713322.1 hypothetical protein N7483_010503 [Penicillium malachiteum]